MFLQGTMRGLVVSHPNSITTCVSTIKAQDLDVGMMLLQTRLATKVKKRLWFHRYLFNSVSLWRVS